MEPCGTPAAVRRHYRHRTPLCPACRQRQTLVNQEKYARKKREKENMTVPRKICPDCGSMDMMPPDGDGWQSCNGCGTDFSPDYEPGDE